MVKEVLLTGKVSERTRQRLMRQGHSPKEIIAKAVPAENPPWFTASPFKGKPLPSVLFVEDAEAVIKALLEDVLPAIQGGSLAEAGFRYDWLAIPPEKYPEAVRSIPTFDMLRQLGLLYHGMS